MTPGDLSTLLQTRAMIILGGFFLGLALLQNHRRTQALLDTAEGHGLAEPRRNWWTGTVRGRWQGFAVELRHMSRRKGVPERLQMTIAAGAAGRIVIRRRTGGLFSRQLTLFGPPLVEPTRFAARDRYWFRADQPMLLETLLSQPDVPAALATNLVTVIDVVELGARRLRILRAIGDAEAERIAREEWRLAGAITASGVVRRAE